MTFRFVHTADLHLDSPLVSLALRDPDLAAEVGVVSRTTLTRIVDLCLTERVDALLISGDLWDGSQTSAKTPRFLKQELSRLSEAGIRSFILRGNHDAASKISRELEPPPLCHVFGTKPSTEQFELGGHSIAVHGVSFAEGAVPESLLPRYVAVHTVALAQDEADKAETRLAAARESLGDPTPVQDLQSLGHLVKRPTRTAIQAAAA